MFELQYLAKTQDLGILPGAFAFLSLDLSRVLSIPLFFALLSLARSVHSRGQMKGFQAYSACSGLRFK